MPSLAANWMHPWLLGGLVAVLLLIGLLAWQRSRRSQDPVMRLRKAATEMLTNFLVPDGEGGEIHVEIALLTEQGILVLDMKNVQGHVFGSNAMQDWTVISDRRRFTFGNPQSALYDRVAAVQRLITDAPVKGFVVFAAGADFSKGLPSDVLLFDDLLEALRDAAPAGAETFRPAWERLREEAVAAQVGHLMRGA